MRTLRDWTAGDRIASVDHHQQAVDALRELRNAIPLPAGDVGAYPEEWTGKIVAHGKDEKGGDLPEPTGPQYWVEKQFILPAYGGNADAVAALAPDMSGEAGVPDGETKPPRIQLVTNLPECAPAGADAAGGPTGCHLLSVGDVVRVWAEYDGGDPNVKRYLMRVDPSPLVRVKDAAGCGKALYNGVALRDPTADVDKSVDLSASNAGAEGPTVVIRNLSERNRTTTDPWLTAAWNTDQRDFPGRLSRVNADGTAVVDIAVLVAKPCDTSGGGGG